MKFRSIIFFCTNDFSSKVFIKSLELNQKMMRLPYKSENVYFEDNYNIYNSFQSVIKLDNSDFKDIKPINYKIIKNDLKFNKIVDWLREVIWYGHRSGKYLCNIELNNQQISDENTSDSGQLIGTYIA